MNNIQRLFLLLCCIAGLGQGIFAQEELSYPEVEQRTLSYFYKGQWKTLMSLGDSALKQEIDYYGLRYRMGVAQYSRNNYWQSTKHFKKTLEFNNADPYAPEYLYYSQLFADKEGEALRFAKAYPDSTRKKWGAQKNRWLDYITFDAGGRFSSQPDSIGHMGVVSIGMGHRFGSFLKLYHNFSFLSQNYLGVKYNQYDYYLKGNVLLGKGWQIIPALHYIHLNGGYTNKILRVDGPTDITNTTKENSLLLYLGVQKTFGRVMVKPYGAYMSLSGQSSTQVKITQGIPPNPPMLVKDTTFENNSVTDKWQFGLDASYRLPVWNNRLTLGGSFAIHMNNDGSLKPIWGASLHGQLTDKFGMSLSFFQAPVTDFVRYDGAIFNNSISPTNWQVGAKAEYYITPKISWNLGYSLDYKQEQNFDFYYHNVFTGLKFRL
ncbi:MAG: hypothetical protein GY810_07125 [Aureispira sp.]|nr:hypothetical protein [Aureispira sp.]